jgi:hypothetical protein
MIFSFSAVGIALSYRLNAAVTAVGSSAIPGPIVALRVNDLMYVPLAAAGFARTSSRRNTDAFSSSFSWSHDAVPTGA